MGVESQLSPVVHRLNPFVEPFGVVDALLDASITDPHIAIGRVVGDGEMEVFNPFIKSKYRERIFGLDLEEFNVGDWCIVSNAPLSTPPYF